MNDYRYRESVIAQLWQHGLHPKTTTSPELVREFLNDLYRYELRRLRDRLVRGEIPKTGYYDLVAHIRRRYPLLALKPHELLE